VTTLSDEQIDELERLERAAWVAPWVAHTFEIDCPCPNGEDCGDTHSCEQIEAPEAYPSSPEEPAAPGEGQCVVQISVPGLESLAGPTAAFIAAARNALPSLLAEVTAARASRSAPPAPERAEIERLARSYKAMEHPAAQEHALAAVLAAFDRALAAHGESATGDVTREAPEIGHDCGTCAHGDLQPLAEPCRSCLHDCASFRGFTRWTAAPPAPSAPTTREACSTPRLAPKGRNGDESTEDHDAPDFCVCGVRMDRHAPSPSPADREESAGGGLCRRLEANGGGMCDMRAGHKGRCGTRISPQGHRRWFAAASPADAKEGTP
jgi:hypothetical protein